MTGHNPIDTSSTPTTRTTAVPSTASPPRLTTLILLSAIAVLPERDPAVATAYCRDVPS